MEADSGATEHEGQPGQDVNAQSEGQSTSTSTGPISTKPKARTRSRKKDPGEDAKRRCVSTACIACRRRKSKCDGNIPACAACASVYNTECVYDPNSDHRRKGVYKRDIDDLKTRNSTLQTLIQAILNYAEEDVPELVKKIRTCESLDAVAEEILTKEAGIEDEELQEDTSPVEESGAAQPTFEKQLSGNMGQLRLDDGSVRYIGGTSNLIHLGVGSEGNARTTTVMKAEQQYQQQKNPIASWTTVTSDPELIFHLMNMYFTWHYAFFTTLPKGLFWKEFLLGLQPEAMRRETEYCTPLLVNAMLALGCHFTSWPAARSDRGDSATAGDHFFKEAKRLIMENDEHETPRLTTVQALALMSVREAGCGREAKGWVYSGMAFRMACDLGLNLDSGVLSSARERNSDEEEEDARRVTFWGCFLFDKCWSNYLGRMPQLTPAIITAPKYDVFPTEEADIWTAYTDSGFNQAHAQPSRTRAVGLQISTLCEISSDLMMAFYNPIDIDKAKGKQQELKKLSDLHQRLETWRRELPKELEPREGGLPAILIMHMFFQLLYIHLFRPFLKYNQATSPLPAHVSPRKLCTQAAAMISKLLRLYKRSHGLRQIVNIAVYIAHSALTIHLLNLPDKNARRDIIHGVKHLEEIAEGWLCARRTLSVLNVLVKKWKVDLPEEASSVLIRADTKWGAYMGDTSTPKQSSAQTMMIAPEQPSTPQHQTHQQQQQTVPTTQPFNPAMFAHLQNAQTSSGIFNTTTGGYMSNAELMRRVSSSHSLPPTQAADIDYPYAQRHNSLQTASTPGDPQQNADNSTSPATAGASPSDMFGGVEQLLKDSHDWYLRDQINLASGFDNWGLSEMDYINAIAGYPSSPTAAAHVNGGLNGLVNGGAVGGANGANGTGTNGANGANGHNGANGSLPGYGPMHAYNESEWYQ